MTKVSPLLQQYRKAIENPDGAKSKLAMVELCDALDIEPGSSAHADLKAQLQAAGWTGAALFTRRSKGEKIGAQHTGEDEKAQAAFGGKPSGSTALAFKAGPCNPWAALDGRAFLEWSTNNEAFQFALQDAAMCSFSDTARLLSAEKVRDATYELQVEKGSLAGGSEQLSMRVVVSGDLNEPVFEFENTAAERMGRQLADSTRRAMHEISEAKKEHDLSGHEMNAQEQEMATRLTKDENFMMAIQMSMSNRIDGVIARARETGGFDVQVNIANFMTGNLETTQHLQVDDAGKL